MTDVTIPSIAVSGSPISSSGWNGNFQALLTFLNTTGVSKYQAGSVASTALQAGSVTADKIAAGAVTEAKIANGSITADKIPDGSIAPGKLVGGGGGGGPAAALPIGTVIQSASLAAPDGFLACNGSAVSRATYSALFSAIGTTFGAGNGTTTFALPDARDRVLLGVSGSKPLGTKLGEESVTLTTSQMPSHTHSVGVSGSVPSHTHAASFSASFSSNDAFRTGYGAAASGTGASAPTSQGGVTGSIWGSVSIGNGGGGTVSSSGTAYSAGGDTAHSNMQPYLALNSYIYAGV